MPYDEAVALTLRAAVARFKFAGADEISERKMFGGLCVLLNGNMFAGVVGSNLMLRLGDGEIEVALRLPYITRMDFTGKPLKNFVYIDPEGIGTKKELDEWIGKAVGYVRGQQDKAKDTEDESAPPIRRKRQG